MQEKHKKILSLVLAVAVLYVVVGVVYSAFRNEKITLSESQAAGKKERSRCGDECNAFDWMFSPFGTPTPNVDVGPEEYTLPNPNN